MIESMSTQIPAHAAVVADMTLQADLFSSPDPRMIAPSYAELLPAIKRLTIDGANVVLVPMEIVAIGSGLSGPLVASLSKDDSPSRRRST